MWRFHDSDYNLFELHWYHVLNYPASLRFPFDILLTVFQV